MDPEKGYKNGQLPPWNLCKNAIQIASKSSSIMKPKSQKTDEFIRKRSRENPGRELIGVIKKLITAFAGYGLNDEHFLQGRD